MPAKFTHTNRALFKTQFFERIGDLDRVYWTDDEVDLIINEAIRTFGGIAQAFKSPVLIDVANPDIYYDITTDLSANEELLQFQLTYGDLLNLINFHLIEEISVSSPTSSITSLDEILKFARTRINQYQQLTGLVLTKARYNLDSPPINLLTVNDELIDIIRVAFINTVDEVESFYRLREEDETDLSFNDRRSFSAPVSIPKWYTTLLGTLNQVWVYPPPLNLGSLEIISINGIAATEVLDLEAVIDLPNNLIHYIKWGILLDIHSKDGLANDPNRAAYCEERWNEGIIIGQNYNSILAAKLNDRPINIESVSTIDDQDSGWQNRTGKPSFIGSLGYNIMVVNRIPNTTYSLELFTITNAYVPVDDADFIDIKQEYIESLLGYCIHLAQYKNGAEAIKETDSLKENFIKMSINHNLRLLKRGITYEDMIQKSKQQQIQEPINIKEAA